MSFWTNNPDIATLIHDTNSALGLIRDSALWLKRETGGKVGRLCGREEAQLIAIDEYVTRCQKAIDAYYQKKRNEQSD